MNWRQYHLARRTSAGRGSRAATGNQVAAEVQAGSEAGADAAGGRTGQTGTRHATGQTGGSCRDANDDVRPINRGDDDDEGVGYDDGHEAARQGKTVWRGRERCGKGGETRSEDGSRCAA